MSLVLNRRQNKFSRNAKVEGTRKVSHKPLITAAKRIQMSMGNFIKKLEAHSRASVSNKCTVAKKAKKSKKVKRSDSMEMASDSMEKPAAMNMASDSMEKPVSMEMASDSMENSAPESESSAAALGDENDMSQSDNMGESQGEMKSQGENAMQESSPQMDGEGESAMNEASSSDMDMSESKPSKGGRMRRR